MKKILNIFASITLITIGASNVVACGSSTPAFDPFNLSTRGSNQINKIRNTYFSDWNKWYKERQDHSWMNWNSDRELDTLLGNINPNISLYSEIGQPTTYVSDYIPFPNYKEDTKTIFTKGLDVYIKGDGKFITGELELTLNL